MAPFDFQIMSDLHLETPKARPSYEEFEVQPQSQCLALLGDIGNVSDPRLLGFLDQQLQQFEIVLYVLGNHEPYGMTFASAQATLCAFEMDIEKRHSSANSKRGKFVFMDRKRYDISEDVTILGCTMFSSIKPKQRDTVARFVSDFSNINDWTVEAHNAAHQGDLQWLNSQVSECAQTEPHRSVAILTHHSPSLLREANDPRHLQDHNQVHSAFATDLSDQVCWASRQVKLWAFGHTHFNCDFVEPQTGKRVLTNQKGYRNAQALTFDGTKVVSVENARLAEDKRPNDMKDKEHSTSKRKHCTVS